jgi:hypothetical protein
MQIKKSAAVFPFILKSFFIFISLMTLIAGLGYLLIPNRSLGNFAIPPVAFALLAIPALIAFIFLSLKFNE